MALAVGIRNGFPLTLALSPPCETIAKPLIGDVVFEFSDQHRGAKGCFPSIPRRIRRFRRCFEVSGLSEGARKRCGPTPAPASASV